MDFRKVKYGPEIIQYLGTLHAVNLFQGRTTRTRMFHLNTYGWLRNCYLIKLRHICLVSEKKTITENQNNGNISKKY